MKIVDTLAEQGLLETLLERSKPPVPPECRHLHYLLATPFRYGAPYPTGSRFRRAGHTPGVFYASTSASTAIGELVFHRLLFFAESPTDVELAKALCLDCPVRAECLAGALERREPWGVWGGQLFLQGVVIPRKRPRGRPRKNEVAA